MNKLSSSILLWISVGLILVLLMLNVVTKWESNVISSGGNYAIDNLVKEPLVLTAVGAILVFLLVDRWRRIEIEISNIRTKQFDVLKNVRDDAENIVKGRLEGTTRKAKAIESKIGGLLEEHPWISTLTENDLIPDASSCKVVLVTCEKLLETNRDSLLYEYLYSWIDKGDKETKLSGTSEDFFELSIFCERILGDEYLGYLILGEGVQYSSNRLYLYPEYLKKSIRHGNYSVSKKYAKYLKRILPIQVQFLGIRYFRSVGMNAKFIFDSYCALIVFESLKGYSKYGMDYTNAAKKYAELLNLEESLMCNLAESKFILGKYKEVYDSLENIKPFKNDKLNTTFPYYELARMYRSIGVSDKFYYYMNAGGYIALENEIDISLNKFDDSSKNEQIISNVETNKE